MGNPILMQVKAWSRSIVLCCSVIFALDALSACSYLPTERVVYDQQGIRIGVEADPTVSRSQQSVSNSHPADLTAEEIQSLLQVIQVSGWSGTLVGMLAAPRPVPLFTAKELSTISDYVAAAFREARPSERVFFSLPKPEVTYSEDRTAGSLFLRGRYLHVVVTDHSAFMQADTAGGDLKDIRDTKSMKLWVAGPAQAAMVPDLEEPRWAPFETVHISLNIKEVLAQRTKTLPVPVSREETTPQSSASSSPLPKNQTGASTEDLQLQIRELTTSNLELRGRLDEQNKRMQRLMDDMEQVRLELDKAKSKKPLPQKTPSP